MRVHYKSFSTKRGFGVEGEFSTSGIDQEEMADVIRMIDPENNVNVTGYQLSDGCDWEVKTDSTCGWEVASYKGYGLDDINNIARCIEAVGNHGASINNQCGLHIHADVKDLTKEQIARVVAHWIRTEAVIFSSVPQHRVNNIYCKMLRKIHQRINVRVWNEADFYQKIKPLDYDSKRNRRVALNICNYEKSLCRPLHDRWTIELRLPEMSTNYNDITNWIKWFVTFVENAKDVPLPYDMRQVSLPKAMQLFGLHSTTGGLILSEGLFGTKEWFLYRVLKHSRNKKLCHDAITMLNDMWFPLRRYHISKGCESFTETL